MMVHVFLFLGAALLTGAVWKFNCPNKVATWCSLSGMLFAGALFVCFSGRFGIRWEPSTPHYGAIVQICREECAAYWAVWLGFGLTGWLCYARVKRRMRQECRKQMEKKGYAGSSLKTADTSRVFLMITGYGAVFILLPALFGRDVALPLLTDSLTAAGRLDAASWRPFIGGMNKAWVLLNLFFLWASLKAMTGRSAIVCWNADGVACSSIERAGKPQTYAWADLSKERQVLSPGRLGPIYYYIVWRGKRKVMAFSSSLLSRPPAGLLRQIDALPERAEAPVVRKS